jgi:hypothetical protein
MEHLEVVAVYVASAMFAGALVGIAGGTVAQMLVPSIRFRATAAAMGLVLLAAREYGLVRFRVPDLGLIIPAQLVAVSPRKAATIWGSVLGAGFLTLIKFGAFWGLQLVVFAFGDPRVGALLGLAYGFARSFPAAIVAAVPLALAKWPTVGAPAVLGCGPLAARVGATTMIVCSIACVYVGIVGLR